MAVALRIVCISAAVFCGALAAPTVTTYDQRQHGEYNVQVDVDDMSVILLFSDEFAQRAQLQLHGGGDNTNTLLQILGRRNGVASRKKHHKKPVNCSTAATTVKPEVPYTELPSTSTSSQGYETVVKPESELDVAVPENLDDQSPSEKNDFETGAAVNSSAETIAIKYEEKPAAVVGGSDNNVTEAVAIPTEEKSTNTTTSRLQASPEVAANSPKTDVETIETVSTSFEENPVSISSDVITVGTITNDETPVKDAGDKSNEPTAVETAKVEEVKPAEMIAIETIEKPTDGAIREQLVVDKPTVDESRVIGLDAPADKKKPDEPTEMVAMKTVEKPTFAEALKVPKKPAADEADTVKDTQPSMSVDLSKSPVVMVAMKTLENPQTAAARPTGTSVEDTGITTSTKPVEIQGDTKTQITPPGENASRSAAPKQTEMVAVKTMENPTTSKSVVSVKAVVKQGVPKSTVSSNSSLIMRKVGDRKPLPTVTLEVAPPKVSYR